MNLETALIIFFLSLLVIFIIARRFQIRFFSSLVLSLGFSYLVLITLRPWATVEGFVEGNIAALFYLLISIIVMSIVSVYLITNIFRDREERK